MADQDNGAGQQNPTLTDEGVALYGDYPANHRLRAEALAQAKVSPDPDGIVSDELIADADRRLTARANAVEAAKAKADAEDKSLGRKSAEELRQIAADEGVVVEGDDNKPDLVRKISDHRAPKSAQ